MILDLCLYIDDFLCGYVKWCECSLDSQIVKFVYDLKIEQMVDVVDTGLDVENELL